VEWIEQDRGDLLDRWVGGVLVAEAFLLMASRIFTLIYNVAQEVNLPDKHRTRPIIFLLFLLISIVPVSILAWAGGQLRRTPGGAWRVATLPGRLDLAAAGLLNVVLATWASVNLVSAGSLGTEGLVAWLLTGLFALVVVVGLVRDAAGRARPIAER
jgi:hypothetical protein